MDSTQQQHIPHGFAVDSHTNIEEASDDVPYEDDGTFDEAHWMLCPIIEQDVAIGAKRKLTDDSSDTSSDKYNSSSEESVFYYSNQPTNQSQSTKSTEESTVDNAWKRIES